MSSTIVTWATHVLGHRLGRVGEHRFFGERSAVRHGEDDDVVFTAFLTDVQAAAADKRSEATFHDASATLHEVADLQGHLATLTIKHSSCDAVTAVRTGALRGTDLPFPASPVMALARAWRR
jgi:fermentation-respiration switch protein FrsA (DUF1100 family)